MVANYIEEYVDSCIEQKINSPDKIREKALLEIEEIDLKLNEADKLRQKKNRLIEIVKHFGFTLPKPKKPVYSVISENSSFSSLNETSKTNILNICQYLEQNVSATPRELLNVCNANAINGAEIYAVIKWLCNTGICKRNNSYVISGPKWENRPSK